MPVRNLELDGKLQAGAAAALEVDLHVVAAQVLAARSTSSSVETSNAM